MDGMSRRESLARATRRRRWPWWVGGVSLLAAALAGTVAWQAIGATPACAAGTSGQATYYTPSGESGNCMFPGFPSDGLYVALGPSEYKAAGACGSYLDVTGPKGSVRVKVVDQCPECAPGHIDLGRTAFARIGNPVEGIIKVSYRTVVDPRTPRPLSFRIKDGASQWWFAVLVDHHGNPLRTVEVRSGSSWRSLARADYNYWIAESGAGPGPFTLRLTDSRGHRVTVSGIRMAPLQIQNTQVSMYGGASSGGVSRSAPAPRATPKPRPTTPTPAPTPTPTPTLSTSAPPPVVAAAPAPSTSESLTLEPDSC